MTFYSSHSQVRTCQQYQTGRRRRRRGLGYRVLGQSSSSSSLLWWKDTAAAQKYINLEMSCLFSFHKEIVCL